MKKLVAVLASALSLSAFANDPHAAMGGTEAAAADAGTKAEKSVAKKTEKKTKTTTETGHEGEGSSTTETSTSTSTKPAKGH